MRLGLGLGFGRARRRAASGGGPPPDVTSPTLVSAVINAAGDTLTLTYDELLDTGSVPTLALGGTARTVSSVNVTGMTVVGTLSGSVGAQLAPITVTAGGAPIRDVAGNNAAALTNQVVTNNVPYVAPTVPVSAKCGYFLIGDDIAGNTSWPARHDTLGVGAPTCVNTVQNAAGWVTPEGNRKTLTLNGTNAYLRINGLAAMATGDDPPLEIVAFYKNNAAGTTALVSWSSTSSTTPKRVLLFTTGGYRWTQQTTTNIFGHNATNLFQQMVRLRVTNNGAGTDTTIWRNEELDPIDADGTLQMNVGAQAVNTFTLGAQDNGGSMTNFQTGEWFALWVRDPAAAPLTDDEAIEIHNFVMGGYETAPLYATSFQHFLMFAAGQSNCPVQGLGTGAVTGLPDAAVKTYIRALNNEANNPIALSSLDRRPGASSYHSSAQYLQTGSFAVPHHIMGVGEGATAIGSWLGSTNGQRGFYQTDLHSEMRRMIYMSRCRFGGAPIVQCVWQQGENDAAAGGVVAAQYGTSFATLVSNLRTMWARMGVSNVPIQVLQLSDSQTGGGITSTDRNTIQAAVDAADAGDANIYAINTDSVTQMGGDNLHFSPAGYAALANLLKTSIKASDVRL